MELYNYIYIYIHNIIILYHISTSRGTNYTPCQASTAAPQPLRRRMSSHGGLVKFMGFQWFLNVFHGF